MTKHKICMTILLAIMAMLLATTGWAAMEDYIFSVGIGPGGFRAIVTEMNVTFVAQTPENAFDMATSAISAHKDKIPTQIADLERQIAALKAQKAELEAQIGKPLEVYALVEPEHVGKYRDKLKILTTTTGIEKHFKVEAYSVLYRRAPNPYGTPLIHGWQFHAWDDGNLDLHE